MTGFTPIDPKKRVTNGQLADGQNKLHQCVHDLGETVRKDRHAASNRDHVMGERMARIEGALGVRLPSAEQYAAGEKAPPVRKKLAGVSQARAMFALVGAALGAASAAAALYKYVFPALEVGVPAVFGGVWAGVVAFHHALMGG